MIHRTKCPRCDGDKRLAGESKCKACDGLGYIAGWEGRISLKRSCAYFADSMVICDHSREELEALLEKACWSL